MKRYYYQKQIADFLKDPLDLILGQLTVNHEFSLDEKQKNSWITQINYLKRWLINIDGNIALEYSIPRMGKRVDCIILSGKMIFPIEFKVGSNSYEPSAINQVFDYALDLKNFHEQSHHRYITPILIATEAIEKHIEINYSEDGISNVLLTNGESLTKFITDLRSFGNDQSINPEEWFDSIYKPTPTIIEAAQALYRGHNVTEISRSDASAINLSKTSKKISEVIKNSKQYKAKAICFITGVPGAGKTLAGLNLVNTWHNKDNSENAVFLSGNGPLVDILREALARDEVSIAKENGIRKSKSESISKAKAFIQNIHHFRDDALTNDRPPIERVVVFDEAQRAWTLKQTSAFMKSKKGINDFNQSEPEFLISVMDRHQDWAVIICLIGGGQEINTGEGGIKEWFSSLTKSFPNWNIYISSKLIDYEYAQGKPLYEEKDKHRIHFYDDFHLAVSVRSFRSEKVASFVKSLLDQDTNEAQEIYKSINKTYPILITRDISKAKQWLKDKARGSERFGLIASSGAIRLKPFAISVKNSIDPVNWFLNDKSDIRSSYYLEDVATEFDVQGLELDWTCVAWDADLRFMNNKWTYKSFIGSSWKDLKDPFTIQYLKNAYRVLLTRARQGMIIFIPHGTTEDKTRLPEFYEETYKYFKTLGILEL